MKVWSQSKPGILSWCPLREESRLFADATPNGTGSPSVLSLKRFNFVGLAPTVETVHTFNDKSPFTSLDWAVHTTQSLGYIAAGHQDGHISILSPGQKSVISTIKTGSQSPVHTISININQTAAFLSVTADNVVQAWDVQNLAEGKNIPVNFSSGLSSGDITAATWHKKSSCFSIFALCDSTGLSTIWDMRAGRPTHSFADSQFKFPLSDIVFSPTNMAHLATASSDQRNSVVLVWDIRNTASPMKRLHGHSGGVTKIEWPSADDRILISAGKDGKVIAWDVESSNQLSSVFEPSSVITQIKWSPFIPGAVLSSTQASEQLYSFTDPSAGSKIPLKQPHFHYIPGGVDVAFDGRIFQYTDKTIKSFLHQEQISEINDFKEFVDALENKDMKSFVQRKTEESKDQEVEHNIWEIIGESMHPETFKEKMCQKLGVAKSNFVQQVKKASAAPEKAAEAPRSSSMELFGPPAGESDLFGSAENSLFGAPPPDAQLFPQNASAEEDVFSDKYQPFRVLPEKEGDEAGYVITKALISGDIQAAVDCAFEAGRYADAIVIASCGSQEFLDQTRQRYLKLQSSSPLIRLVSDVLGNNLDQFVRYAKTEDWKEIFAVLCNFAEDNFEELSAQLGNRIIAERNDYRSALVCFVAARNFEMVQQCLFQIYEQQNLSEGNPTATILIVLEKLCAMAGDKSCDVIAPLAHSFLQHIVQSGHKNEAIRFLDAIPTNRTLSDLKNAIVGEPRAQKRSTPQQTPNVKAVPPKPQVFQQQVSNVFTPAPQPMPAPVQPAPQNLGPQAYLISPVAIPPAPVAKPQIFNPAANAPAVQPQPAYVPNPNPSAVPPPNSHDPRQRGRPTSYVPPPPPTASQVQNNDAHLIPVAAPQPVPSSPVSNPVPAFPVPSTNTTYTQPELYTPFQPQQQPVSVAPPPPSSKAVINKPPTINIVAPRPVQQPQPQYQAPGQSGPVLTPPPPSQAHISVPPPMPAQPYQVPAHVPQQVQSPMSVPEQVPEPVAPRSPEATIDEVPEDTKPLVQGFLHFIDMADSRQDKTPQVKKAIQDARAKFPYVCAAFRDREVPEPLQTELANFFTKLEENDIQGAQQIRKQQVLKYMTQCKNVVLLMNYLQNALA